MAMESYNDIYKNIFPQTASEATRQYYTNKISQIENEYQQGLNLAANARDKTIAQAYRDYLAATSPYGITAEKLSNSGLSRQGGYGAILQGYANMARSNANVEAQNNYNDMLNTLNSSRASALNSLMGNYSNMLRQDEADSYTKELNAKSERNTNLANAQNYLESIMNSQDIDLLNQSDDKDVYINNWKKALTSIYNLDDTTADVLINSYLPQKADEEIALNGSETKTTKTSKITLEEIKSAPLLSAITEPQDFHSEFRADTSNLLSKKEALKVGLGNIKATDDTIEVIYKGNDGKLYMLLSSGKWAPVTYVG